VQCAQCCCNSCLLQKLICSLVLLCTSRWLLSGRYCVGLCADVGSAVNKYPPRQYVAPRRDFPSERAGSDAAASYRRLAQSKMRIQRPRARGYDGSCQKAEVMNSCAVKLIYVGS